VCAALYSVFSRPYINRSSALGVFDGGNGSRRGRSRRHRHALWRARSDCEIRGRSDGTALYLAAGGGALNFFLVVLALQRASPTRVTITIAVVPLLGALLAAILLAEPITFNLAFGLVAVSAGIWLATMDVPKSPTAPTPGR
jgi:hypothetical protein